MATLILDAPAPSSVWSEEPRPAATGADRSRWLVFEYVPTALFSLKSSRATSTAGKTLPMPTPYAVKMAFLDAALRNGFTEDPDGLVRWLARAVLRIGVPRDACVTGTIQTVRQEIRDGERKRNHALPPYRASIAMREFVHYRGALRLAFDRQSCPAELIALLVQLAPAINYLGKRGSFIQYQGASGQDSLDPAFAQPVEDREANPGGGQRVTLDDFGARASFAALNSFATTPVRADTDRRFVESTVPFSVFNSGPGFVHYRRPGYPDK